MHKQFTYKWAGNFSVLVLFILLLSTECFAEQDKNVGFPTRKLISSEVEWSHYDRIAKLSLQEDRTNGISYIISGGIALAGGLAGANITSDPLERVIYALFQTIGVASVGYGAYKWKVGDEERLLMSALRNTSELSHQQKLAFLNAYHQEKKQIKEQERYIKAITHGLIAALNFYNASQQRQDGVKNTLNFIGGANLLASLSYTF